MPIDGSDPLENYRTIRSELEHYSPALASRPEVLVVTKMDLSGSAEARARIAEALGREVLSISAVTGQGNSRASWRQSPIRLAASPDDEAPAVSSPAGEPTIPTAR